MRSIWKLLSTLAVVSATALLITPGAVEAQRGRSINPPPVTPPPPRLTPEFNKKASEISNRGVAANPGKYTQPPDNLGTGKLVNPQPIKKSPKSLQKVRDQHMEGGSKTKPDDGRFYRGENVEALIKRAESRPAYWQKKTANYVRVVRMDRKVGTWVRDKGSGRQHTNVYSVVTDANNNLVSLFPGLPRINHLSK